MLKIWGLAAFFLAGWGLVACGDPDPTTDSGQPKVDTGVVGNDAGGVTDALPLPDAQATDAFEPDASVGDAISVDAPAGDALVDDAAADLDAELLDAGPEADAEPGMDAADLDAAPSDGPEPDGATDAGAVDASPGDTGPTDATPGDTGPTDAAPGDTGPGDAGVGAGTCASPRVAQLGINSGDTSATASADEGSCVGTGQHEEVWTFTAPSAGTLRLVLDAASDLGLYVRSNCVDPLTEVDCADNDSGGASETLDVSVTAGQIVSIVVDGYDGLNDNFGPYTLTLSVLPDACTVPLSAMLGTQSGDTSLGVNTYQGTCEGDFSAEQIWSFTPAQSGVLHVVVDSSLADLVLYARTQCADGLSEMDCIDQGGSGETETLDLNVTSAAPVFIFVDGYGGDFGAYTMTLSF